MLFEKKVTLSRLISNSVGRLVKDQGNHILMYHSIGTDVEGKHGIYGIEESLFYSHMQYLKEKNDSAVVSLMDWSKGKDTLAITFDDGFTGVLTLAAPILTSLNLPFTVFVSPAFVQATDRRYLDIQGLVELSMIDNCTIGAHGYSHTPLTKCDDVILKREVEDSKAWLEDILRIQVNAMSYPHGNVDNRVRDAVERAGYKIAASSKPGGNFPNSDPLQLKRTEIWSIDDEKTFGSKVNGFWDWMKWVV